MSVSLNGLPVNYGVISDTQLVFTIPTGGTSGLISITTPAGTGTSSGSFTVP